MEKITVVWLASVLIILTIASEVSSQGSKSGYCPPPSSVRSCINRCRSDFECPGTNKCCPNSCGSSSCADSKPISHGAVGGNSAVYCNNVRCRLGEKCILDRRTNKKKCGLQ